MSYTYYRRYQKPQRKKRSQFAAFFWLLLILVILVFVLKACVSVVGAFTKERQDDIVLSVEKGSGEVLSFGQSEWETASDLGVILEGDSVQSAALSNLILDVHDGPRIRMDEESYLSFDRVEKDENGETEIHLVLHDGRIWYDNTEETSTSVVIHTDLMRVSGGTQFLLSNTASAESLYVFDGTVEVDYVDRGLEEVVLESLSLPARTKSLVTPEVEAALLARESVALSEAMDADEFEENEFVQWSLGEIPLEEDLEPLEEEEEELEDEPVEEEEVVAPEPDALSIKITSPLAGSSDTDGAIAIEGTILNGTAQRVVITWSGNGQPYPLGLFEPGSTAFRYVADQQYGNFQAGPNTYTVTAYDAEGNPSNTVSVTIQGDF